MDNRGRTLLEAAAGLLAKCDDGPYVKNVLEETVHYDGADCDGSCLLEDIMLYLKHGV